MRAQLLFASSVLALSLVAGCDGRKTGSTEPQATPAGGRVTGSGATGTTGRPMDNGTSTPSGSVRPLSGSGDTSGDTNRPYSAPTTSPAPGKTPTGGAMPADGTGY